MTRNLARFFRLAFKCHLQLIGPCPFSNFEGEFNLSLKFLLFNLMLFKILVFPLWGHNPGNILYPPRLQARLPVMVCDQGRFPFNKNSGLKFGKFSVPNGTVHSGCTDPTRTTARLVIVLVSRMQKRGTGDNNFVKWKGIFRSKRPKWADRSKWITF